MNLFSVCILSLAISLDGLVVGITYGLKKIKIEVLPILIISVSSAITILVSMSLGSLLSSFLSPRWAVKIGGIFLIVIGIWLFYQSLSDLVVQEDKKNKRSQEEINQIFSFKIKSLGIIINILKEPVEADVDYSGVISNREALFLGVALAFDAFGAGIAAAMTGYYPVVTALTVGGFKFLLLSLGLYLGAHIQENILGDKIRLLPGIILILLGLSKLI